MQFMQIVFRNNINFTYETLPDLKDSAYAIGYFCAGLLKADRRAFSKREFIEEIEKYCKSKAVDLDVGVIFDILTRERIVVASLMGYVFHYTHWVYFFSAQHMYASEEFRSYVLDNCTYARFPEVIEFYSAIDRHRRDLISTLSEQLESQRKAFEARSQIPITANLYDILKWKVGKDEVQKLADGVTQFLAETDLPTEVKDKIADQDYDYTKPYSQELRAFLDHASLAQNIHIMIAAARALRNSDHVDKVHKLPLMREVLFVWKQLLQTALLVAKDMVHSQSGMYEDVLFVADWTAAIKPQEAFRNLVQGLPVTVSALFYTDLATKRMGPLLEFALLNEEDQLLRFFLATQILYSKPKEWIRILGNYIASTDADSYYLSGFNVVLRRDYKNGFNEEPSKAGIRVLLGRIVAKHQLDISHPNQKTAKSIEENVQKQLDKEG